MSEPQNAASTSSASPEPDPLASLHRMSTTAGVGSTDYVAINPLAVTAFVMSLISVLVFLSWALLIVPLAALILGVAALRQVADSNGTQGGKKLAIAAIVLSLIFAGTVASLEVRQRQAAVGAQREIAAVVDQFSRSMQTGDWGAMYPLFTEDFRMRWPSDRFIERMNEVKENTRLGELRGVAAGPKVNLETTPTGERAHGTILFDFANMQSPLQVGAEFRKAGGQWMIQDVPDLFPLVMPEP